MEHGVLASHERQFATPDLGETGCFEPNEPINKRNELTEVEVRDRLDRRTGSVALAALLAAGKVARKPTQPRP